MTNILICNQCKHWGSVGWAYKQPGCKLAKVDHGNGDGYGPWYGGPACIHDTMKSKLESKFEPTGNGESQAYFEHERAMLKRIDDLESEIRRKEEIIKKLT